MSIMTLTGVAIMFLLREIGILGLQEFILGTILLIYISGTVYFLNYQSRVILDSLNDVRKSTNLTKNSAILPGGIDMVYRNQSQAYAELPNIVKSAKKYVNILATSRISIYWGASFEDEILANVERGLQLNILLPNPYTVTKFRDLLNSQQFEDQYLGANTREEIMLDIKKWDKLLRIAKRSKSLQVRYYEFLPTISLVITDDILIFNSEFYSSKLLSSPAISASRGNNSIYETYLSYFEMVWNEASPKF
jgi:hypothetical protein